MIPHLFCLLPISELALAEGICYPRCPLGCPPVVADGEARAVLVARHARAGCCGKTGGLFDDLRRTICLTILADFCKTKYCKNRMPLS